MKKKKAKAIGRVPQNREEAVASIGRIGSLRREILAQKVAVDEGVRLLGEAMEREIAPLAEELAELERGVQIWCEANRALLTNDNRVKFHDFGTGRVNWRALPPKVTIKGVDVVIEAIKKLGLRRRFLRIKEEVNKEAMLADAVTARKIIGVTISSDGEDFLIEPLEITGPSSMQAEA